MFFDSNYTESFEAADNQNKFLLEIALNGLSPCGPDLSLTHFTDLYANPDFKNRAFLIERGAVAYQCDGKTLFHYDEGDLIGLELPASPPKSTFYTDSPVVLRPYDKAQLLESSRTSVEKARQWCDYLLSECARQTALIATLEQPTQKAPLGFQTFAAGATMIEEGTDSDTVYSIVEGHADVYVNRVKVGEVGENEIFGAMSMLTKSPRSATVVARTQCMVMVVPHIHFESLIASHPRIGMNLMENMARQIHELNQKVTAKAS